MSETEYAQSQLELRKIESLLVEELLNHSLLTLITSYGVALLIYWVLHASSESQFANYWICLFSLLALLRYGHLSYSRKIITQHTAATIARQYLVGALASGLVWASLIFAYDVSQPLHVQLFLLITLVGMPMASMASNAFYLPVFLGFGLPILLALLLWAVYLSPAFHLEFSIMGILYAILVVSIAKRYFLTLKNSIQRGEENQRLIREVKEANAKLIHLAYHDPLTNLSNRRQFEENAQRLLSDPGNVLYSLALMLVDVDDFKIVNDTLGHKHGDRLLQEISGRIRTVSRQSELIMQTQVEAARIGGDEFIIMYHMDSRDAEIEILAQRVLNTLTAPMLLGDAQFKPSVSIGIALAPRHATRIEDLMSLADTAMYKAKQAGGNRYKISDEILEIH
jgi:diguanylate cyclase (GGDEF)-like protein